MSPPRVVLGAILEESGSAGDRQEVPTTWQNYDMSALGREMYGSVGEHATRSALSDLRIRTPRQRELDAVLVLPSLRDVAHPLDGLIIRLLEHLQESHMQTRCRKHGNLKIHDDWWPAPCLIAHG